MKHALAFLFVFTGGQCFAQCPFTVSIKNNGIACAGSSTLVMVSSNPNISQIIWYNGSTPDTLVTAVKAPGISTGITVAGGNGRGAAPNQFNFPDALFVDGNGYLYVSDITNNRIQKFPPGSTSATAGQTVAGGNGTGSAGNQLQPNSVYVDSNGNMYVADNANARVLKFPPGSTASTMGITVAGGNGQGTAANQFVNPVALSGDTGGSLYVTDAFNNRVQKFPPGSNSLTSAVTVAGGNGYGPGPGQFNGPAGICVDSKGNLYVADAANNRIQKFLPGSLIGITVAGGNGFGAAGNQLATPSSVWVDSAGFIYVADVNNERIQKFPPGSTSATYGKTVAGGYGAGSGPTQFSGPNSVCVDAAGNIYVVDAGNNRVQKFKQPADSTSVIDTLYNPRTAGTYTAVVTDEFGCTDTSNAIVINPLVRPAISIAAAAQSNGGGCNGPVRDTISFVADATGGGASPAYQWQVDGLNKGGDSTGFTAILSANDIVTCTLTSNAACATTPTVTSAGYKVQVNGALVAGLSGTGALCAGRDTLVVKSNGNISKIMWYNGTQLDTTVTGSTPHYAQAGITVAGGNGQGSAPNQFFYPSAVYVDGGGNLFVADQFNYRVQKFPPGSTASTAGQTAAGGNGEGTADNQMQPVALTGDADGYLYVADHENFRIIRFPQGSNSSTNGQTMAGGNGQGSFPNQFNAPTSVGLDAIKNIYVADAYNARIQKFPPGSTSATAGVTIAGGNGYGSAANQFTGPYGLFVDRQGNVYVTDYGNSRVQKFPPGSTRATLGFTVAGGNGQGEAANQLSLPVALFVDAAGNIYVAEEGNNRIQKFPPGSTSATQGITVAGGNGKGSAANQLNDPLSVFVDSAGNVYVADANNNRVQKFVLAPGIIDTTYLPATPGTYTAVVTSTNGCTDTTNAIVISPVQTPAATIAMSPQGICAGSLAAFNATATNAGAAPVYTWLLNGKPTNNNGPVYTPNALANGDSIVCMVTGGPGCYSAGTSNTVVATVWPLPVAGPATGVAISPGQSITLSMPVKGDIATYLWLPPDGLNSNTVAQPVARPARTTTYTLTVTTAYGCRDTASLTVDVFSHIYLPGAFTPNGDGRNDIFYVIGGLAGDRVKDFAVYGRWGQRLFQVHDVPPGDPTYGWDGYSNGLPQPPGTYIYIAVITSSNGNETVYKGEVVLLR